MRPTDFINGKILDEYRMLSRRMKEPFTLIPLGDDLCEIKTNFNPDSTRIILNKENCTIGISIINWIKENPRIVKVNEDQYQTLSQVDINLEVRDFTMPFHTIMVEFPTGKLYKGCLLDQISENILIASLFGRVNAVTVILQKEGRFIQDRLCHYSENLLEVKELISSAMCVACNMVLAMRNGFGVCVPQRDRKRQTPFIGEWGTE